jgi:hypothetical protein
MKSLIHFLYIPVLLVAITTFGQTGTIPAPTGGAKDLGNIAINSNNKSVVLPVISSLMTVPANCQPMTCSPLPVTLLSFDGKRLDVNNVTLNWKTTNEVNNMGFDVERSLGSTGQFVKVGFVQALQDQELIKEYSFPDPNSFAGTSYYRLRQIDLDSNSVYSRIIAIENTGQGESMTLYPNPVKSLLNLEIVSQNGGNAELYVIDAMGRVIARQSLYLNNGTSLQSLNVNALTAGMYFIRLRTASGKPLTGSFLKN